MDSITSRDNQRLKQARAARDGRERELIFIEGLRLAEEAAAANLEIADFFYTPDFTRTNRAQEVLEKLQNQPVEGAVINLKLLESISDTKTPQGIILLARKPKTGKEIFEQIVSQNKSPLFVVLHRLNNPANVGAVLRTAEAAGASGAILTKQTADPFAPKSLRAAMGSAFRLPLWANAEFAQVVDFCRSNGIRTVCADVRADKSYTEIVWTAPRAFFIGSEAHGFTEAEVMQADETLKIPMNAPVESLNAAVACGVILYEAARQREK